MTTVPPSPAQGETAGVSEQRLKELAYVDDTRPTTAELLAVIDNLIDNHAHYATIYDYIYQAYRVKLVAIRQIVGGEEVARQQLAELESNKRALEGVYAVAVKSQTELSQQLAEMRTELEYAHQVNETRHKRICELLAEKIFGHARPTCDVCKGPLSFSDDNCWCPDCDAALAPTSHDPVRSAGETRSVPSRGKPFSAQEALRQPPPNRYSEFPDCAQGGSPADPERQGAEFDRNVPDDIKSQPNFYRDLAREMTARADRVSLFLDAFAELVATGQSVMVPDEQIPESGLFTITAKARHVREFNHAMRRALKADVPPRPSPPPTDDRNQCDGCRANMPLNSAGHHVAPDGQVFMACTADRYISSTDDIVAGLTEIADRLEGSDPDAAKLVGRAIAALKGAK